MSALPPPPFPGDKAAMEKILMAAFTELSRGAERGNVEDQAMLWRLVAGRATLADLSSLLDIGLLALEDAHF